MSLVDDVRAWLIAHEWVIEAEHAPGPAAIFEIGPSDGDAPWPVFVEVDPDDAYLAVQSILPDVPVHRREALALAMVRVNNGLRVGRFDLDLDDGDARFVTSVVLGSAPPADVLERALARLLSRNLTTVDAYADALTDVVGGADPHEAVLAAERD